MACSVESRHCYHGSDGKIGDGTYLALLVYSYMEMVHDTEKESEEENGCITLLSGGKLYSSMFSTRPSLWHLAGDAGC